MRKTGLDSFNTEKITRQEFIKKVRGVLFCRETGKAFPRFLICSEDGYNANIY